MNHLSNRHLTKNAQKLRRNMTKEERHLWYDFLKELPLTVNRQKVIGHYIADFYIAEARLVIELDGLQHGEPENHSADEIRDHFLSSNGIRVLRYTNTDINQNFLNVCESISSFLSEDL